MRRLLVIFVCMLILLLPVLPFIPKSWVTLFNQIGISAIVVIGIVVLTGCAGITSFGQAAFVGCGAYTTALLSTQGFSPWLTIVPSILLTGIVAYLVGLVALRLSGHYLALASIAWSICLFYAFGVSDLLGRFDGITGIPAAKIGGAELLDPASFYYVIWTAVLLCVVATRNLISTRPGRAIRALRGGRLAAESFGIDTAAARRVAFVYAAMLAGLSGWLFAHLQRAVNPTPFGLNISIDYVLMAVVGGIGKISGAILGSVVVAMVQDQLQNILPRILHSNENFETVVFGVSLVLLLQFVPQGLGPFLYGLFPAKGIREGNIKSNSENLSRRELPIPGSSILSVSQLNKTFGGLVAVKEFSCELRAGQIVGLIGPNGAGKSTTFNLITGINSSNSGLVRYKGRDISNLSPRRIAQLGLTRTFQHAKLVPDMSVIENVMLGMHLRTGVGPVRGILGLGKREEELVRAEAFEMLDLCGLAALASQPALSLPLGQQRIVEVARALCLDPALLLLDEPAAGLRKVEKVELSRLLKSLKARGMTIFIVEHDMEFVMGLVDDLIVMNFGSKLAEGSPEKIQSNSAVIEAYLGAPHVPAHA